MTNKYKQIKIYPRCDYLGVIVEKIGAYYENKEYSLCIHESEVENFPEFWELIIEKNWEILDQEYNGLIGKWEIKAVKRKCDGEIFSIGDKLYFRDGEVRKITDISLNDTGVLEFSKRSIPWLECGKDYGICLDRAVHYKEPILITEDGVELFEGDIVYFVKIGDHLYKGRERVNSHKHNYSPDKNFKYFSTEELRDKYLEENKPMYSKKDILNLYKELKVHTFSYWDILLDNMLIKKGE